MSEADRGSSRPVAVDEDDENGKAEEEGMLAFWKKEMFLGGERRESTTGWDRR